MGISQNNQSNKININLIEQPEFPSQISTSVKKTYENNSTLVKCCYCGGCNKNNQTTFKIVINKMDLIQSREFVKINVIYSMNKRKCKHLDGKVFGQCRGYARQILSRSTEFKSPHDMRKKILSTFKNEVRYTGNRQDYSLCERLHAAIKDVNSKEKDDYIKKNGVHLVNKRQLWGFIQEPIQTQPLSIVLFNEAGIYYYHYNVGNNPGIFLDYTGQLVKLVPHYLTPLNNSNKKILNAFFTMISSENSSDAPPVNVFELVTNDLSSKNLQYYLHVSDKRNYNYLVQIHENVDQYIDRIMNSVINNKFDSSKVIVGWLQSRDLSKFAMRAWNSVRVKETLPDAEREIEKWEWVMSQEYFKLTDMKSSLLNPEEKDSWTYGLDDNTLLRILQDNNKDCKLIIPQLNITVSVQLSQLKNIKNPFYSLNLVKYLDGEQ
ncbi:hypothetical protein C1646_763370 [Rhizophagus diaphanus]|nr:hypothetical protein C1646_763370 [Rhizophagus diaphanus] [Rhizophagus sp. MUCL 43196]